MTWTSTQIDQVLGRWAEPTGHPDPSATWQGPTGHPDPVLHPGAPITQKPPRGLPTPQYIYFFGQDHNNAASFYSFNVLCGEQPPTIIGGYAKWQTVDRPLWRGITVFQGYDPAQMQLSVRFISVASGTVDHSDNAGRRIEEAIGKLEWMAGSGRESGAPPFVYLSTQDTNGDTSALIPFEYQNSPTSNVPKLLRNSYVWPWVITALEWDQAPMRNRNGFRVRQDATMTVELYQGAGKDNVPSAAHRDSPSLKGKALAFYAKAGADTALEIAGQVNIANNRFALATAIIKYSQNKHLHLRSVKQKIKIGTRILIPFNY